ncbi:MAG: hypothetical protein M1832_002596 [Thelocarpon impressellum]|nr:MAG: hypothetical protein M1832_002596 [Thelocarpon impressellum]
MASANPIGPDSLITIKVAIAGTNRRFKLPLRELGANVLPDKLCSLLDIASPSNVVFERYSDSAAAFITLDANNPAVYKQLYRAAKAKLKLRIKATLITVPDEAAQPEQAAPVGQEPEPTVAEDEANPWPRRSWVTPPSAPKAPVWPLSAGQEPAPIVETRSLFAQWPQPGSQAKSQCLAPLPTGPTSPPQGACHSLLPEMARPPQYAEAARALYQPPGVPRFPGTSYSVYCNSCDVPIPHAHYHCSICDDGDFDLCQACVDAGVLCHGEDHWLIKRFVQDHKVINSTTETIAPRKGVEEGLAETDGSDQREPSLKPLQALLTCNQCSFSGVPSQTDFVSCATCDGYDLCVPCHVRQKHGHHPGHAFRPAAPGSPLTPFVASLCPPGRNTSHYAICDGCDKAINGVRHKCLNCPDWDYCSACVQNARYMHPGHRFAPIYEPIAPAFIRGQKHYGIFCDGPMCTSKPHKTPIVGDRYKCAVCHDTDFCANCEASPVNRHNRTHPLIKFKSPVRNVSVSTVGEKDNGEAMPSMGDQQVRTRSAATETHPPAPSSNAATQVQIVADLKPSEKAAASTEAQVTPAPTMNAGFVRDTVVDGSKIGPNHVFEQTWTLFNPGPAPWPKGCSLKFVGGDNMRNLDPAHPTSVADLERSIQSNVLSEEVGAGEERDFTVTLRTPAREGLCISYWRLTAPDGAMIGRHRLWCFVDVTRRAEEAKIEVEHIEDIEDERREEAERAAAAETKARRETESESSTMIFPTLDKESPASSTHGAVSHAAKVTDEEEEELLEDVASLAIEEDEQTDDGFCTDEEYDILDASDEEFLATAQKEVQK